MASSNTVHIDRSRCKRIREYRHRCTQHRHRIDGLAFYPKMFARVGRDHGEAEVQKGTENRVRDQKRQHPPSTPIPDHDTRH